MSNHPLGANRGIIEYCETKCGEVLDISHIFKCTVMNNLEEDYNYEKILNGYTMEKKIHLEVWNKNMKKRENYLRTQ